MVREPLLANTSVFSTGCHHENIIPRSLYILSPLVMCHVKCSCFIVRRSFPPAAGPGDPPLGLPCFTAIFSAPPPASVSRDPLSLSASSRRDTDTFTRGCCWWSGPVRPGLHCRWAGRSALPRGDGRETGKSVLCFTGVRVY